MDDIIEAIITAMEATLPSAATVMYGDAVDLSADKYPCVCIIPAETEQLLRGTGAMKTENFTIDVKVYLGLRSRLQQDTTTIKYMQDLVNFMEERDDNYRPKSTTVLGILNANLSLGGTVGIINPAGNIRYTDVANSRTGMAVLRLKATRILS